MTKSEKRTEKTKEKSLRAIRIERSDISAENRDGLRYSHSIRDLLPTQLFI